MLFSSPRLSCSSMLLVSTVPSFTIAKQCVWVYWIMVFLCLLASQIYIISFRRHSVFINLSFFYQIRRIGKTENLNPNRPLDCNALMKPSFCFCFVTSQLKWNPIAPSKQQNICCIRFELFSPRLLHKLHCEGTTIVMVTHSARDAAYSDRIVNLFDGCVVDEVVM